MSARPSDLCPVCRDCDGRGYSSPDDCARCQGRGWLAFNTKCGAEHKRLVPDIGVTFLHRCNRDPWHEGDHVESGIVNDGTFHDPRLREYKVTWPQETPSQCTTKERP